MTKSYLNIKVAQDLLLLDQEQVIEIINPSSSFENIMGTLLYRHRQELVEVVDLSRELELGTAGTINGCLVVVQGEGGKFALKVDEVGQITKGVLLPLPAKVSHIESFSGVVISDEQLKLVIEVGSFKRNYSTEKSETSEAIEETAVKKTQYLVVNSGGQRFAISFDKAKRVEALKPEKLKKVGRKEVYLSNGQLIETATLKSKGNVGIIVQNSTGTRMLRVDEVLEVIEASEVNALSDKTVSGSIIHDNRVVSVLDIDSFLEENFSKMNF